MGQSQSSGCPFIFPKTMADAKRGFTNMNKMFKPRLTLNLQQFAEGDPEPIPTPAPTPQPTPTPTPKPEGTVWTDEYVRGLRAEAKEHRTQKQQYDGMLRSLLGLKPGDEINDSLVSVYQKTQQQTISDALSKANTRLLDAEIKGLEGYDTKLLNKLIDRSKITIGEDGAVTGLTEQLAELEKEFPAIKSASGGSGGGVNPGAAGAKSEIEELQEAYDKAPNLATRIAIKNKIFALQSKQ